MDDLDWGRLVLMARRSEPGLEALLAALEDYIQSMACKMASSCQDDAAQAARVAIWTKLRRVDARRHSRSVRGWLLTVAANAIRDEARRSIRRRAIQIDPDAVLQDVPAGRLPAGQEEVFRGILREYLGGIRYLGGIEGVRALCARRHRISPSQMSTRFRAAAAAHVLATEGP